MKKDITLLISLILVFCLFVFQITIIFITFKPTIKGKVIIDENSNILMSNVTLNNKSNTSLKIDEKNNKINLNIEDVKNFKENFITLDITNISSKDITLQNYEITDVNSLEKDKIEITTSLKNETTLKKSEKIRIKIYIKNKEKIKNSTYYNANIKFILK